MKCTPRATGAIHAARTLPKDRNRFMNKALRNPIFRKTVLNAETPDLQGKSAITNLRECLQSELQSKEIEINDGDGPADGAKKYPGPGVRGMEKLSKKRCLTSGRRDPQQIGHSFSLLARDLVALLLNSGPGCEQTRDSNRCQRAANRL
jgi:hypothetical protein